VTEILRPIRSAIGAATSAPIKVPIESYRLLAHAFKLQQNYSPEQR
jgi:hypothetical protein